MRDVAVAIAIPGVLGVVGILSLTIWLSTGPVERLHARVPGLDRPLAAGPGSAPAKPLVGKFTPGEGKASSLAGEWPRFRGSRFDGIAEATALARQWPEGGPKRLWPLDLGEGYAGAAVHAGRVYVLDYDRQALADALRCLSLDDGREIWRYSYPNPIKRNHGMSRTVPAVTEKYLVALGPQCHVTCLDPIAGVDPATGKPLWTLDLVRQFGATVPPWYAGQCPLVENDRAIFAPAGPDALLVAIDCRTGKPLWKTPNPRGWRMTHSSIMPMELDGRRMYVYCGSGGVAGVAADDGSLLWSTTDWKISIATVPSPLILPGGKIFFSGGYNSGSLMLQVRHEGGQFTTKTLFRLAPEQFGSTQQTPVFYKGFLYGVREKDKELVCLNPEGNELWSSGTQHRFGLGSYLVADDLIYAMDDTGLLTMAEASPDGWKPLGQAQVLEGHDAWGPMALVAGRLIVRDFTRMICLDVAAGAATATPPR